MRSRSASKIRAVTFDAGGTLLEPWPSVGDVYSAAAATVGIPGLDPSELNHRFRATWRDRGHFDYSRRSWAQVVKETFRTQTDRAEDPQLFEAVWTRFQHPDAWRIYPDVAPCLQTLQRLGIRLAVVSNWDDRLGPLLVATGLASHFEFILPSVHAPAPKPHPSIFQAAAERLALSPEEILHVGDSRREDAEGARQAGFSAVLIDRNPVRSAQGSVGSLVELSQRLV